MSAKTVYLLDLGNEWRGGQRQVLHLARACAKAGLDVAVAAPKGSPLLAEAGVAGISVLGVPSRSGLSLFNFLALARQLRRRPGCILHTQDARSALLGALLKAFSPARFFLVHTRRVAYPLRCGPASWKYRAADALVAVSGEIAALLRAAGIADEKVRVIHSGIDPARYKRASPPPAPGEPWRFGIIGALTPQKGHAVLLDAAAHLQTLANTPWSLDIAGQGALLPELQAHSQTLGLAELVHFLGWQESRDLLPQWSAVLVPSIDGEGSSAAIKEAWASRLPVIASNLPSNQELVHNESSGLLVPVGNSQALAEAMLRLMTTPALPPALIQGGAERLIRFTHTRMTEENLRLYNELWK